MTRLGVEVIAVILAALGVWGWFAYHDHQLIQEGVKKQIAIEKTQSDKVIAEADRQTQENLVRAQDAEKKLHETEQRLASYVASHPDLDVSGLCAQHHSQTLLPKGSTTGKSGTASGTVLQPVPKADSGVGPDRPGLLIALAALADDREAKLARCQSK